MESETARSNPYADMPQGVRMEKAKLLIGQAVTGAAMSYGLTLPETATAVECVLSDLRGNVIALITSQYQELAVPEPTMTPVDEPEKKTA